MCATVSSHILSYAAIYRYTALDYYHSESIGYVSLTGSPDLPLLTRPHKITCYITNHASKEIYQNSIARH
jgi:hypothetical protein